MKLTKSERKDFLRFINEYARREEVKRMKEFIQHGSISTFSHCFSVAKTSYILNRRLKLGVDDKSLVKAAFLHDFYLYDWHEPSAEHRLHGFSHAKKAADNALYYFGLSKTEYEAIESHMWPLNLTKIPKNRIAWLVCLCDKYCAAVETVFGR